MARRGLVFDDAQKAMLTHVFDTTKRERDAWLANLSFRKIV